MKAIARWATLVALGIVIGTSQAAWASITLTSNSAASTSGLGFYTGTFTYTPISTTTATVVVSLTNTSPAANSGFLTAIAFNNPDNLITSVTLSTATGLSNLLGGASFQNGVSANPFGDFDIGASTSNIGFEGGGNPNTGLGVGESGSLTFSLVGTGLDNLTESSFLNTLNENANANFSNQFFIARFRGFRNGGSDKVPSGGDGQVPEPATLAIWSCLFALAIPARLLQRRWTA